MKAKEIFRVAGVTVLALVFFSVSLIGVNTIAFANAASNRAPITAVEIQEFPIALAVPNTEERMVNQVTPHIPPSITVVSSPFRYDAAPPTAMSMEDAALMGAEYVWDVFGANLDGKYVIMNYMNCWLRPGHGIWQGVVALGGDAPQAEWFSVTNTVSWEWGETTFSFTIDSVTGERMDISYFTPRGSHHSRYIAHDTQVLWESAQGRALQSMTGYQIAEFIGMPLEQVETYRQEATALASAHFNNSRVQTVELGVTFSTPVGPMRMPGVHILIDTDAGGNIIGTFEGIDFTVTDNNGTEAIVSIFEWMGFRMLSVRTIVQMEDDHRVHIPATRHEHINIHYFQTTTVPAHLREMWEEDDAEVLRLSGLNSRGVFADELPYFGLWSRWEMLEQIERLIPIEMRHLEMTRQELTRYVTVAATVTRLARMPEGENTMHYSFFDMVRENYTDADIDVYVELGAPEWLIDMLRMEIS